MAATKQINVLEEALAELKVVNEERGIKFHNKSYSMVADRVEVFRKHFTHDYSIVTEIMNEDISQINIKGNSIVIQAYIQDQNGRIISSGHASEVVGAGSVNRTSALENAETSAIGRALALFGLHGGEFASGDEINGLDRKNSVVDSLDDDLLDDAPVEEEKPNPDLIVSKEKDDEGWQKVVDVFEKVSKMPSTVPQLTEVWRLNNPLIKEIESSDTDSFLMIKSFFAERRAEIQKGAKDNV